MVLKYTDQPKHAVCHLSAAKITTFAVWQGILSWRGNDVLIGALSQIDLHVNASTQGFLLGPVSLHKLVFFPQWNLVPSPLVAQ